MDMQMSRVICLAWKESLEKDVFGMIWKGIPIYLKDFYPTLPPPIQEALKAAYNKSKINERHSL